MPYADPEKAREQRRRWYLENRDKVIDRRRNDPERWEKHKATSRRYYHTNRQKYAEQGRAWRRANPEKVRENYLRWRASGGRNPWNRRRDEAVSRLWHEQDGRCYLCEQPVPLKDAVLEHDHRCCPRLEFCDTCIRGVACNRCNHAIGHAGDDPDRLELIARNLRVKLAEVDKRLTATPVQLTLGDVS